MITESESLKHSMNRGDNAKIMKFFDDTNWEAMEHLNVDDTWNYIKDKYQQAVKEYVPQCTQRSLKWTRPLRMNGQARKSSKNKYWAWKRYANTGSQEDYEKYTRKRNVSQNINLQLRRDFEKLIAKEAKKEAFWRYLKSLMKTREDTTMIPEFETKEVEQPLTAITVLEKVVRRHMMNHLQHTVWLQS